MLSTSDAKIFVTDLPDYAMQPARIARRDDRLDDHPAGIRREEIVANRVERNVDRHGLPPQRCAARPGR